MPVVGATGAADGTASVAGVGEYITVVAGTGAADGAADVAGAGVGLIDLSGSLLVDVTLYAGVANFRYMNSTFPLAVLFAQPRVIGPLAFSSLLPVGISGTGPLTGPLWVEESPMANVWVLE